MEETIKTTCKGMGGFWVSMWQMLPELVSISVGLATLMYLIIKITKELK